MAKTITLTYDGEMYTLEYNRDAVRQMENSGFRVTDIESKPVTSLPRLFEGAFVKNHKGIKRRVVDELFDKIPDKMAFLSALSEMYNDTVETLIDDPEESEGNAVWEQNW